VYADYNLQMYELEELLSRCNLKCLHVQFRVERAIICSLMRSYYVRFYQSVDKQVKSFDCNNKNYYCSSSAAGEV
jgi:hypothetical protein